MDFVVDANILFSAIIKDSATRKILCSEDMHLSSPEFVLLELNEHKEEIMQKAALNKSEFEELVKVLFGLIKIVEKKDFAYKLEEASHIRPDKEDSPYFSLCLAKNIPLWSNDSKLKNQEKVLVYSTADLIRKFNILVH